jgi:hypothetical protein
MPYGHQAGLSIVPRGQIHALGLALGLGLGIKVQVLLDRVRGDGWLGMDNQFIFETRPFRCYIDGCIHDQDFLSTATLQ